MLEDFQSLDLGSIMNIKKYMHNGVRFQHLCLIHECFTFYLIWKKETDMFWLVNPAIR